MVVIELAIEHYFCLGGQFLVASTSPGCGHAEQNTDSWLGDFASHFIVVTSALKSHPVWFLPFMAGLWTGLVIELFQTPKNQIGTDQKKPVQTGLY